MSKRTDDGFCAEDFLHTRDLLMDSNDKIVRAALSNNLNIIIAALVRAAALQHFIDAEPNSKVKGQDDSRMAARELP